MLSIYNRPFFFIFVRLIKKLPLPTFILFKMPLEVIGAGCSRTGTYSLHTALEILGYRTHHGFSLVIDPEQDPDVWHDGNEKKELVDVDWEKAYGGYQAAVDWPTYSFYQQLADYYPESKVILTVRPPDSWFTSVEQTILPLARWRFIRRWVPRHMWLMQDLWCRTFINGAVTDPEDESPLFDRDNMIRCYNEHIKQVKETIPKERLLIMTMDDGWEPLCKFLGKPIPTGRPFPVTNSRLAFTNFFWDPMRECYHESIIIRIAARIMTFRDVVKTGNRKLSDNKTAKYIITPTRTAALFYIIFKVLTRHFSLF
ncbi:P-loop containing nucleoside triphosphate hydrolase protein [Circinella umbellata]|nr:P-loop containing nucleoside triphosphate hydrolase protein [Circinella umbellata]